MWWWIIKKMSLIVVLRCTSTTSNSNFLVFWWDYCTAVNKVLNLLDLYLFLLSNVQLFWCKEKKSDLFIKFWISPDCLLYTTDFSSTYFQIHDIYMFSDTFLYIFLNCSGSRPITWYLNESCYYFYSLSSKFLVFAKDWH